MSAETRLDLILHNRALVAQRAAKNLADAKAAAAFVAQQKAVKS